MKRLTILILLAFSFITTSNAQKLIENKTDEFTKSTIKRTSWCAFTKKKGSNRPYQSNFQISKINDKVYLELKMMLNNQVYSINEGDEIMFLMEDESVVSIKNIRYAITNYGEGAVGYGGSANLGTTSTYFISEENVKKLMDGKIKKIRIYTSKDYRLTYLNNNYI